MRREYKLALCQSARVDDALFGLGFLSDEARTQPSPSVGLNRVRPDSKACRQMREARPYLYGDLNAQPVVYSPLVAVCFPLFCLVVADDDGILRQLLEEAARVTGLSRMCAVSVSSLRCGGAAVHARTHIQVEVQRPDLRGGQRQEEEQLPG